MNNRRFCDIDSPRELVEYLGRSSRLNGVKLFNKYLSLDTVKVIFETRTLLLNNPKEMNDLYEYKAFSESLVWNKILFF